MTAPGKRTRVLAGTLPFVVFACSKGQASAPGGGGAPTSAVSDDRQTDRPTEFTRPSASSENETGAANPSPEEAVRLLDNGRAPRRRLRYAWRVKQAEQIVLEMRTSLSNEKAIAKDVRLPSVRTVIEVVPRSVSNDGSLIYAWKVVSGQVTGAEGLAPQGVDGLRIEVAAVEHLSGTAEVTSRGLGRSLSIDPSAYSDAAAARPIAQQVLQTLWNLAAPLPDEEVGLDAHWRRVSQLIVKSSRATQTDLFTLLALDENGGSLDDVLAQTAPHQLVRVPGVDREARAQMESMLASGDAKTHFDLSHLVPQVKFLGVTTMVLSNDSASGTPPPAKMVLRVEIDMAGSSR